MLDTISVFDHFFLMSTDWKRPERWEWKLNDVHGFYGVGSIMQGWFISEKFKNVLTRFEIAKPFKFYPSKLLYKGVKLDYYVMQIAGHFTENINLDKSEFFYAEQDEKYNYTFNAPFTDKIIDKDDYIEKSRKQNWQISIYLKKMVFDRFIDLIFLSGLRNQYLVSERLRTAIEEAGITGLEFSESDIEFEVLT